MTTNGNAREMLMSALRNEFGPDLEWLREQAKFAEVVKDSIGSVDDLTRIVSVGKQLLKSRES
jgi:hypothetical protein